MAKRILTSVIIILILGSNQVLPQNTFNVIIRDTTNDHTAWDAIELPSGDFFILDEMWDTSYISSARLSKISAKGEIVKQKYFQS